MSQAITPNQALNTTTFERSYAARYLADPTMSSARKAIAKAWPSAFGSWRCDPLFGENSRREESATVKKYQNTLNQLVAHTAKTEISDLRIQKHGIQPKPATGPNDFWHHRAKRSNELRYKIEAFYEALKERVELIEPTDSTKQVELYTAGLEELRSKIQAHPSKMQPGMAEYLIDRIRDRAFTDLANKITPLHVTHQQLKPLERAVDCFSRVFDPQLSQKALSQVIRQNIQYAHAHAFEAQIEALICSIRDKFVAVEAQIETTKILLEGLKEDFDRCPDASEKEKLKQRYEKMCTQLKDLYAEWQQLDTQEKPQVEKQIANLQLFTKESTVAPKKFFELTEHTDFPKRRHALGQKALQPAPIKAQIKEIDSQIKKIEMQIKTLNSEARTLTHQLPTLKRIASTNRPQILALHRRAYSHPWYKTYTDKEYVQAVTNLRKQNELVGEIEAANESLTKLAECEAKLATGKQTVIQLQQQLHSLNQKKIQLGYKIK